MPNYSVLVIDDSSFVYKMIESCFHDTKYDLVGYAGDGYQGIEMYQRLKPDLVILDYAMPGIDGIETAKQIKKIDPDVKIIILSALEKEDLISPFSEIGISVIFKKPFHPDQLRKEADLMMHQLISMP